MKKKLILITLLIALFVCLFVISANAAQIAGYQQFEVELTDGSKITVYESAAWDQWQGRLNFTDNTYTEPPLDTEQTYPLLDWSKVVVADFTNGHRMQLNTTTGEYVETYGTNGGYSMHLNATGFTKANATNLKTIKTGAATLVLGGTLGSLPALEEVICSEKLKEIGWNAFDNNKKLTKIDFSACTNFTTFGNQVFLGCTALETITLPNTITSMGGSVFSGCTNLKSINWPTNITTIPSSTFSGCTNLVFEIPTCVTSIGASAFQNCDSLVSVTIHDNITNLGSYAFSSCDNLEEIVISDNSLVANKLIGIAEYCPKLTSFRIPPLVTELGYDNFRGCTKLAEIIWPNNLTKISSGNNFANCTSLTTITFPNTLTTMSGGNLSGCTNLTEIRFGAKLTNIGSGNLNLKSLKRVYIPATIIEVGSNILGYSNPADSSSNITFIFTGNEAQAKALQALVLAKTEGTNHAPNSSKLYDAELVSASKYDVSQEPNGFKLVYDYNICTAFYNSVHKVGTPVYTFDSYLTEAHMIGTCSQCNEQSISETYDAIVSFLGIAIKMDGTATTAGYALNEDSLAVYVSEGYTFNYGVVGYIPTAEQGNSYSPLTIGENGVEAIDKQYTIHADISGEYASVDFIIKGFPQEAVSLIMCMYVYNGTDIVYLCGATEADLEQVATAYAVTVDVASNSVTKA
ncbi:MAG: leucine-rich repeat domain-containing protein [Clostridia bacterium]|nr:leucine-rich repeat domain-containing protein [Clostridia bacterium]